MKNIFALIGLGFSITIVAVIFCFIVSAIKELFENLKFKYKQKHRFDKTPTAKCYCIDCTCYDTKTGKCYRLNRNTADCYFCCDAEPRKKELKENV